MLYMAILRDRETGDVSQTEADSAQPAESWRAGEGYDSGQYELVELIAVVEDPQLPEPPIEP
jgi:hypothetical protein